MKYYILPVVGVVLLTACTAQLPGTTVPSSTNNQGSSSASVSSTPSAQVKEFTLEARNFSFSQTDLTVKKDDRVRIVLTSVDGPHDWVIDEFNARTKVIGNGQSDTIEFTADKTGTFEYYCSVDGHRQMGMKGSLTVTE
jgi:plastocyanin